jgi:hypothetical protein
MNDKGKEFFNIISSLHTSRVSAYGFTAEANVLGLTEYAISEQLDSRICPVCKLMHGKVFKVQDARSLLDIVIRATEPDDLKQLQPWPKQNKKALAELEAMTNEQLVAKGWHIPPYHPRCRGLLTRVGKVPDLDSLPDMVQENYAASAEDFSALGIEPTDKLVRAWNERMNISPAEALARTTGQKVSDVLRQADGEKPSWLELLHLAHEYSTYSEGAEDVIEIRTIKEIFQSQEVIDLNYYIGAPTIVDIVRMNVGEKDAEYFRTLMMLTYGMALDAEMESLVVTAGSRYVATSVGIGGWAWAQYGFTPTRDGWKAIKASVVEKLPTLGADELEYRAIQKVLESEDPSTIFALASLAHGRDLLLGTVWTGVLNLNDEISVSRFLAYMGAPQP